ncbi:MAG: recombinase family protein [Clostridia bacterium]|nr:recombinase family protein [Clostridia bacterium]
MSRKSRYNIEEQKPKAIEWKAAGYIRLSREDKKSKDFDSLSVFHQKRLISRFLEKNPEIRLIDYFIDDGYTGTDLERPDFQRLQRMYEKGEINCIIVKDLSRLARNNEESSKLIYVIFPFFKIRFISINDNVDSYLNPESVEKLDVKFKNIMHDEYARDNSKKVISACRLKRSKGIFLGAFARYGYKKDPNNKGKLIVDEYAAEVVKYIFAEFLKTRNQNRIANTLTEKRILPPAAYKQANGEKYKNPAGKTMRWSTATINEILKSDVYIGNMTQNQRRTISYKDHRIIRAERDYWITVEGTHEPIISKEDFDKVQQILAEQASRKCGSGYRNKRTRPNVMKCGHCGRTLSVVQRSKKTKSVYCENLYSPLKCGFEKRIHLELIENVILEVLNRYIDVCTNIRKSINDTNDNLRRTNPEKNRLQEIQEEIERLAVKKGELYSTYKQGELKENEYLEERQRIDGRIVFLQNNIKKVKEERSAKKGYSVDENAVLVSAGKYKRIKKLSNEIIDEFIEKVDVYSEERIDVHFKFKDEFQEAIEFLRENESEELSQGFTMT